MTANAAPVRTAPGRSRPGVIGHNRCRYCNEFETLAHVLGSCPRGNLLHINMHNRIRMRIAEAFRIRGFQVSEEVHCVSDTGSNRHPTVRFEINSGYPEVVHQEKCGIYNSCRQYLLEKYKLNEIEVIGLLIGARGTIQPFFENFRKRFNLPKNLREDIVLIALKGSSLKF